MFSDAGIHVADIPLGEFLQAQVQQRLGVIDVPKLDTFDIFPIVLINIKRFQPFFRQLILQTVSRTFLIFCDGVFLNSGFLNFKISEIFNIDQAERLYFFIQGRQNYSAVKIGIFSGNLEGDLVYIIELSGESDVSGGKRAENFLIDFTQIEGGGIRHII